VSRDGTITVGEARTVVHTAAIDQPALHGIIDRVAGLGLTLLSGTPADVGRPEPEG
jgi:hypothetical protein